MKTWEDWVAQVLDSKTGKFFSKFENLEIVTDSRKVTANSIFVAIQGEKADGHQFLSAVAALNPSAILIQSDQKATAISLATGYPSENLVECENTRRALAFLARAKSGYPTRDLFCVGVTGTNGKTSVTHMVEWILNKQGLLTGVLGTIDHHLGSHVWSSADMTTPDPITLQSRLSEMRTQGAKAIAFEVSSHALSQLRADGIEFDVALFTNLTRDHLDYHQSMEEYFEAKSRLFLDCLFKSKKKSKFAILNCDDEAGKSLAIRIEAKQQIAKLNSKEALRVVCFGQNPNSEFRFQILEQNFGGSQVLLTHEKDSFIFKLSVIGLHNVYNAVAAILAAWGAGIELEKAAKSLHDFRGAKGRLEAVPNSKQRFVFVDYAHTDDALRSILRVMNEIRTQSNPNGKIITVFGCGGDRDKGKRPLMTQAAIQGSSFVILTSDNPRTEDPQAIIDDCLSGVSKDLKDTVVFVEIERSRAIAKAIQMSQPGDIVLIAGKGHEESQTIGKEKRPFSDQKVAREMLDEL